jgi:hypothetical protein
MKKINLIITTAVNYDWEKIKFFIKSYSKYHINSNLIVIIGTKDFQLKEKLNRFKIKYYETKVHRYDIQEKRYHYALDILKNNSQYNKVLLCDSRDVYFQKNIFSHNFEKNINFFLEDGIIKNSEHNSNWMKKTIGLSEYSKICNKSISCGGTVLGEKKTMINYCKLMIGLYKKFPYKKKLKYILLLQTDKESRGCDQSYHNFLLHNNFFSNLKIHNNQNGPIANIGLSSKFKFDKKGKLLNKKKNIYSLVHQYDRHMNKFKEAINKLNKL